MLPLTIITLNIAIIIIALISIAQEPFDDGADGERLKIFRPFHDRSNARG